MCDYEDEFPSGIFGCCVPANKFTKRMLHIGDILISAGVVAPLVVTHWWGTWMFMDNHPDYFPIWPTLLFGLFWHLMMVLTRHHVHKRIKRPENVKNTLKRRIINLLFTKCYTYMFSIASCLTWRGYFYVLNDLGRKLEQFRIIIIEV